MKKTSYITTYLKQIVYGGSDGIITTFAVVAGFNGAQNQLNMLPYFTILLFGFANLFADATSMGIGSFLSDRSEKNKKNTSKSLSKGLATFLAFIIFGLIPLIPYLFTQTNNTFYVSIFFTFMALVLLGIVRGNATKESLKKAVAEVVLLGGISATVAYIVGILFRI